MVLAEAIASSALPPTSALKQPGLDTMRLLNGTCGTISLSDPPRHVAPGVMKYSVKNDLYTIELRPSSTASSARIVPVWKATPCLVRLMGNAYRKRKEAEGAGRVFAQGPALTRQDGHCVTSHTGNPVYISFQAEHQTVMHTDDLIYIAEALEHYISLYHVGDTNIQYITKINPPRVVGSGVFGLLIT